MKKTKLILIVFLIFINGCASNAVEIDTGDHFVKVNVEIADTDEEQRTGLMNRESLGEYEGMLFIFEDSRERTFWMKNTLIPLDIIFISEDFEIINIERAEPCEKDPCTLYKSNGNAMYVLEVNEGFSEKSNINVGNSVEIL